MKTTTQSEAQKPRKAENPFRKYAPFATGVALITVMTLSPFAAGQPQRAAQCSASVQSGTIPGYHSRGRGVHLISTPLMREGRYLSLSIPDRYMDSLNTAARQRPDAERRAFVRDAIHRNLETAMGRLRTGDRATFDCVPLDSVSAVPSASVSATADAGPREQQPPVVSGDAGTRQVPPVVSSAVPDDAGSATRRRTISPGGQ